jgi:hypothetical protein
MFVHEAKQHLADGKRVGRRGWPDGDHLVEMDETEVKEWKLRADVKVEVIPGTLIYVSEGGRRAEIGYVPTADDQRCSDWYLV